MGSIYLFNEPLTMHQINSMYCLGSEYQNQFKFETESNLPEGYKKVVWCREHRLTCGSAPRFWKNGEETWKSEKSRKKWVKMRKNAIFRVGRVQNLDLQWVRPLQISNPCQPMATNTSWKPQTFKIIVFIRRKIGEFDDVCVLSSKLWSSDVPWN